MATATLPVLGLVVYLTLSRGGAVAAAAGLVALVALHPRRLALLPQLAIGAVGTGALILAADARPGFTGGLGVNAQGDEMTLFVLIVCALSGIARLGVTAAADRYPLPSAPWPSTTGRTKAAIAAGGVAVIVAVGIAAGVPGEVSDGWERFKDPEVSQDSGRLGSASGNGRYQYWDAAVQAYDSAPILGIGAGAFRYWWTREGTIPGEVVDAHSLYLESLGELGIVGFALIVALVGGALGVMGAATALSSRRRRRELAAAFAAAFAFAVGAGLDWAWELPVLPVAFLIVVGAVLARPDDGEALDEPGSRGMRRGVVVASLLAALVIVPPMLGATALRDGRERVAAGDLTGALNDANWGLRVEPYSGTAALQKALVLEQLGRITDGSALARKATRKEPTNWQAWLALSRMQNELSDFTKSAESYAKAKSLNPNSSLFERIARERRKG